MPNLAGKRIVVLVEQMHNELEFWYPKIRLQEAGAQVIVAGPEAGKNYPGKNGTPVKADVAFADVDPAKIDGVVIPGGFAPDYMRRSQACLDLVRALHEQGKPVAFICHAGWVPLSAGIVKGKHVTSVASIKDDMKNAGALWEDSSVVIDDNLVSSRKPDDLPDFMRALLKLLQGN